MNNMERWRFFTIGFVMAGCFAFASANGAAKRCFTVLDEESNPVAGAVVAVSDSVTVVHDEAVVTDEYGKGCIEEEFTESAMVEFRALGFERMSSRYADCRDTVVLRHDARYLEELTVVANKDVMTQKGGTFVFTPGSLKTEVPNVFTLIQYVPLVDYVNGVFKILGKQDGSLKIKINGQEPREWGGAVMQVLQSFPATSIKRIEITPEAGASEGASFKGGILNIIMDIPDEGVLNRISASTSYNRRLSNSDSYWLAWRTNRFKGSATIGFSQRAYDNSSEDIYDYHELGKRVEETTHTKSDEQSVSGSVSMTYNLTSTGVIGVGLGVQSGHGWSLHSSEGLTTQLNGASTRSSFERSSRTPWYTPAWGVSAWYTERPNPRKNSIDIYGGYSHNSIASREDYDGREESILPYGRYCLLNNEYTSGVFQGRFNQVLSPKHLIQTGYVFNLLDMHDVQYPAISDINDFHYKEITNRAYISWGAYFSQLFSMTLGMSIENLHLSGIQTNGDTHFSHDYFGIYPMASFSFNIPNGSQSISLNVARKIEAPLYLSLNPFKEWSSENSYHVGNPDLKPSMPWTVGLVYSFLGNWVFSANYKHDPDMRDNYTFEKDGYTVSSSKNMTKYDYANANLEYSRSFWNRLRLNVAAGLTYFSRAGEFDGVLRSRDEMVFNTNVRANLVLSQRHAWRVSMAFRYRTPDGGLTSDGLHSYTLMADMSKEFGSSWQLKFSCDRILFNRAATTFDSDTYSYYIRTVHIPVQLNLSVSYTFGNMLVKGAQDRSIDIK